MSCLCLSYSALCHSVWVQAWNMWIKVLVNCIYKSSRAARSDLWAGFAAGRPAVTIVIISHLLWASACAEGLGICLFLRLEGDGVWVAPERGRELQRFIAQSQKWPVTTLLTCFHWSCGGVVAHRCGYCQGTGRTIGMNVGNLQQGRDVRSAPSLTRKVGVYSQGARGGWSAMENYWEGRWGWAV